jgi:hypothetical protein
MRGVIDYISKMQKSNQTDNIEVEASAQIPGLNNQDSMVFKSICEISIANDSDWIELDEIQEIFVDNYLQEDDFLESIDLLLEVSYIRGDRTIDGKVHSFQITPVGFERYTKSYLPQFDALMIKVLKAIVERNITDNKSLSSVLDEQQVLVDFSLNILTARNYFEISRALGGHIYVDQVLVKGKRAARNS